MRVPLIAFYTVENMLTTCVPDSWACVSFACLLLATRGLLRVPSFLGQQQVPQNSENFHNQFIFLLPSVRQRMSSMYHKIIYSIFLEYNL